MMQSIAIILICIIAKSFIGADANTSAVVEYDVLTVNRSPMSFVNNNKNDSDDHGLSILVQSITPDNSNAHAVNNIYASHHRYDQHDDDNKNNSSSNHFHTRTIQKLTSQANDNQVDAIRRINKTVMIETKNYNTDEEIKSGNRKEFSEWNVFNESHRHRRYIHIGDSQDVCNSMCNCMKDNFLTIECTFDHVSIKWK